MSKTVFFHTGCGGNIMAELIGFKLVSPFIGIGYSKLSIPTYQFMTEDFKTPKGEQEVRISYVCNTCQRQIVDIENEISAVCVICNNLFKIKELFATDYSPINCKHCLDQLKGEGREKLKEVFDIPAERIRKRSLVDILNTPVKI